MEFFSGFKWAVPVAFSDAVSRCLFEEGDILYDSPKAYEGEWGSVSSHIEFSLQVKYPARGIGVVSDDGSSTFASNWGSEVKVDVYRRLKKVTEDEIETTQGRLYATLWRGDLRILHRDSDEPQLPISVRQVTRDLEQVSRVAKEMTKGTPVFVMAHDSSNPVSNGKYAKILWKLNKSDAHPPKRLSPKSAGLKDWANIAPTINIAFFRPDSVSATKLHELIKEAVYVPAADAKKDSFRLAAHGAIF